MVSPKIGEGAFRGDVEAATSVRVNRKGGSLTAILKKALADRLGSETKSLAAASIDLGSGRSILLMGAAELADRIRVHRSGSDRVELYVEEEGDLEVDGVAAAFLRLKTNQFERGQLNLSRPIDAQTWAARSEALFLAAANDARDSEPAKSGTWVVISSHQHDRDAVIEAAERVFREESDRLSEAASATFEDVISMARDLSNEAAEDEEKSASAKSDEA